MGVKPLPPKNNQITEVNGSDASFLSQLVAVTGFEPASPQINEDVNQKWYAYPLITTYS
jgi:hypothetical protein